VRIQSPLLRYLPFLLINLGVLLIIIYAVFFRSIYPAPGIRIEYRTGIIKELDEGGFFHGKGIVKGDRIVSVHGKPWSRAISIYDGAKVGETNYWDIARRGNVFELSATLPSPTWPQRLEHNIPLLVALVYWGIATLLWFYNPTHSLIRQFFILSQLIAIVLVSGSLDAYTVRWGFGLYLFSVLWLVPVTVQFFASFPLQYRSPLARKVVKGSYLLALILSVPLVLFLRGHSLLWANQAILQIIFFIFIVSVALSLTFLVRHWFNAPLLVRQRRHIILAGILISLLPVLVYYITTTVFGRLHYLSFNWLYLGLIFFPLAVAFALYSGELGRIDWFLNRTLVSVLLFGLMAGIYAGLFLILDAIVPKTHRLFLPMSTLLFLLLAVLFTPLHRLLQYGVDQLFYRGWYDYHRVIERTGEELLSVRQPEDLAHALLENLTTSMRLHCACILIPITPQDPEARLYVHAPHMPPIQELSKERFSRNSPLYQALEQLTRPVTTESLLHQLPVSMLSPAERTLLNHRYVRLWIPVRMYSSDLETVQGGGTLIVGAKLNGEPFTSSDKVILDNLARYVAMVIQKLHLLAQLQQRERQLTHLYKNLTLAREEERGRIARDLHDKIIQDLHVIHYRLRQENIQEPIEDVLDDAAQLLRKSIDDIRRICYDLRPATLDVLGLPDALKTLARQLKQRTGIQTEVVITGDEMMPLPEEVENMLFRIAQEALWNVEKHAQARHVLIQLIFPNGNTPPEEATIRLIIEDDGEGFDVSSVSKDLVERQAYGLLNMKERAKIIGGRFQLRSQPGAGTHIEVEVPLHAPVIYKPIIADGGDE